MNLTQFLNRGGYYKGCAFLISPRFAKRADNERGWTPSFSSHFFKTRRNQERAIFKISGSDRHGNVVPGNSNGTLPSNLERANEQRSHQNSFYSKKLPPITELVADSLVSDPPNTRRKHDISICSETRLTRAGQGLGWRREARLSLSPSSHRGAAVV